MIPNSEKMIVTVFGKRHIMSVKRGGKFNLYKCPFCTCEFVDVKDLEWHLEGWYMCRFELQKRIGQLSQGVVGYG